MVHIINSLFLSQSALASVLGDWFFITKNNSTSSCHIYYGDAHNLFGNICGKSITDLEPTAKTIQAFISTNLALAVIHFFATYLRKDMKIFNIILSLIIFTIGLISSILWHTTDKENMPSDDVINYYGVGWIFQVAVVAFAAASLLLSFTTQ